MGIVNNGGVEAVIMNYYQYIDKSKIQFDFVVHKGASKEYQNKVKLLGGKVYEITPYSKNIFAFVYDIYRIIKSGQYKIVHSNMNALSCFPLAAAFFAGAPIRILHNHTTDNKAEWKRTIVKRFLRPFAKLFANQHWACSNWAARWMYGKKALEDNKVTIINNAIDLEKFKFNEQSRSKLRKELDIENCFVIGHVGRFMKQKNHSFLIDIFNEICEQKENVKLLLIGEGPLRQQMEEKVKLLNLTEKVLFLGTRNDIADLYNVMDCFILPSLYEGLGIVAIEAQVNGLIVIASREVPKEVCISELIEFYGLNYTAKEWSNKIIKTFGEYRSMTNISTNSKFDIKSESKKLEKIYLSLNTEGF